MRMYRGESRTKTMVGKKCTKEVATGVIVSSKLHVNGL
jgi:hypothetical protein